MRLKQTSSVTALDLSFPCVRSYQKAAVQAPVLAKVSSKAFRQVSQKVQESLVKMLFRKVRELCQGMVIRLKFHLLCSLKIPTLSLCLLSFVEMVHLWGIEMRKECCR